MTGTEYHQGVLGLTAMVRQAGSLVPLAALHMSQMFGHPWISKNCGLPTQSWEKDAIKPVLFGFRAHGKITLMAGWWEKTEIVCVY